MIYFALDTLMDEMHIAQPENEEGENNKSGYGRDDNSSLDGSDKNSDSWTQ